MTVCPFDSTLHKSLFGDEEIAALFSDQAVLASLVDVEIALAKAEAAAGLIPEKACTQIVSGLKNFTPDPTDLGQRMGAYGVVVPPFLEIARKALKDDAKQYLHWGATSQDVVDTALIIRLAEIFPILESHLQTTISLIDDLAREHADTIMVGRTRSQQATPTTFGYKAFQWGLPLKRHVKRMTELKPRLLALSLGGASGTLAALGEKAVEVVKRMAEILHLAVPESTWHTQRDNLVEFAGWLSMVTGGLGKMGQDLLLMAQSEVDEVRFTGGGGSSTMPQKSNPIEAEILVTLSRFSAGLLGTIHQAQIQEHERGGPGWMLEWLILPQMVMSTAVALQHTKRMLGNLVVNSDRMQHHLDRSNGFSMAEAAVFTLSDHLPRTDAQLLVKKACEESRQTGDHLIDILERQLNHPIDWKALRDPGKYTGVAPEKARKTSP